LGAVNIVISAPETKWQDLKTLLLRYASTVQVCTGPRNISNGNNKQISDLTCNVVHALDISGRGRRMISANIKYIIDEHEVVYGE